VVICILFERLTQKAFFYSSKDKRLIFVTNNSTKSRTKYVEKFQSLGLHGVNEDEIFGSAFSAACYLKGIDFPGDKYVYVMGQHGIVDELAHMGIQSCGLKVRALSHWHSQMDAMLSLETSALKSKNSAGWKRYDFGIY
jgi:ribonucleotide monophosphatase NagD (HAD superfamily)